MKGKRFLTLILAAALGFCLFTGGVRADTTTAEAKASLADVDITQTLNTRTSDHILYNYANGRNVTITYDASLGMTDLMADYLTSRESQLMEANFTIALHAEFSKLEFANAGTDGTVSFTFRSTFLKVLDGDLYDVAYAGAEVSNGYTFYKYTLTVKAADIAGKDNFSVNAALIAYADGTGAYTYSELKSGAVSGWESKPSFSMGMTKEAWMQPITLGTATLTPTADTVTSVFNGTVVTCKAEGTIKGTFKYATADKMATLGDFAKDYDNYSKTAAYGNDLDKNGWISNEVTAVLYYADDTPTPPTPPLLNTADHFAYIIGYPEGDVRPGGNITRAEVATIYFRMLTDEARNQFWSTDNTYTDVSSSDWFNNAVSTLSRMGIIMGYDDGTFQPNANITRAEFAAIAVRFFDTSNTKVTADAFSDISGHWAEQYINIAKSLGLVNGYTDGTYLPNNDITRAESMKLVNNTLKRTPSVDSLITGMIEWPDNADKTVWYYADVQEATNSHTFETGSDGFERWTKILEVRDWAAFEKAWSDANSATNPGEVVG